MIGSIVALLLPALALSAFLWRPPRRRRITPAAVAVALCLGIGFSSITTTCLTLIGVGPGHASFVMLDLLIWTAVALLTFFVVQGSGLLPSALASDDGQPPDDWLVRAAFCLTAACALATLVASYLASPHGGWDAWAIWNLHARFLFRGADEWRAALTVDWSHPEYPLLLPASVARLWAYAGHESTIAPALVAGLFAGSIVLVVMDALDVRRDRAWIAAALLLGGGPLIVQVPSQCADVPLAFFIVASLAMMCRRDGALVAGALSAMAAWTKDEGIPFAWMMLLVAMGASVRQRQRGHMLWWLVGAAPVLATIAWFKLEVAPPSVLFQGQSLGTIAERMFDGERHLTVVRLLAHGMMRGGSSSAFGIVPLMVVMSVWLAVTKGGIAARTVLVVVGLMFATYYGVYVVTPFDIAWHISTSFDRLLAQLWPSLVLAAFLPFDSRSGRPEP